MIQTQFISHKFTTSTYCLVSSLQIFFLFNAHHFHHLSTLRHLFKQMSQTREKMGFVLDPTKCSGLSLTEKRELVHEIAQWTKDAPIILSSFTRKELLEIICAEMGKERKYAGCSKSQMIDQLLKLMNKNHKRSNVDIPANVRFGFKRQRGKETQVPLFADLNVVPIENMKVCENAACRAKLSLDDVFCKRCSCCICYRYDDNKDPSLWLTCGSDSPGEDACGFTCHLICALKDGRSGIMNVGSATKLDGSFRCVSCGKINGLMGIWKKLLTIAKEARRVDALCLRVLLCFRILTGTEKYKEMLKSVETALRMLVNELGPSDLVSAKMARGIVSRLSCGADVQKLCADALEAYDLMSFCSSPDNMEKEAASCRIRFEESSPTTVVLVFDYVDPCGDSDYLGCKLWHRKSTVKDYPEMGIIVIAPKKRFKLTGLSPGTEYFFKVSLLNSCGVFGTWEAKWMTSPSNRSSITSLDERRNQENTTLGNPVTLLDEQRNQENTATDQVHPKTKTRKIKITSGDQLRRKKLAKDAKKGRNDGLSAKGSRHDRMSSLPWCNEDVSGISAEPLYPPTPCKANEASELSSCIKGKEESAYDYSVRVIKWLEQKEHINEDFRVKFLTWFSLKASMQERRVVNAFVDCFIDDPPCLAGQLMHTFMDEICTDQKRVPPGFCYRLWH